ncbi:MAG: adenylate/guanylate cyclase domain-containing protein [Chloroflexota bacterium]
MADGRAQEPAFGAGLESALDARLIAADLIRNLRHRLRSPINHLIGYSEMLQDDAATRGLYQISAPLTGIRDASKSLLEFVNDTLDLSTLEAGILDPEMIDIGLRSTIDVVVGHADALSTEIDAAGWEEAVPDLQRIQASTQQLLELVASVVDLSKMRFSDLGPVDTEFEAEAGLAAEVRETAATAVHEAHPQQVEVASLLVVDDDELDRDVLYRRLTRLGHQVSLAQDGFQALEMMRAAQFDVVLLEVLLPEMTGYDVLEEIKRDEDLRHIPVIVLSSLDGIDWVSRCIEIGAEDYIPKPVDPTLLQARIDASLEKKRFHDREVMFLHQIEEEKQRADDLLHVILPDEIVAELKETNQVQPRRHDNVAVLFCDIVSFTPYCDGKQPQEIVANLQQLVEEQEELAIANDLHKVKTIGDSFMATCGLLHPVDNPVLNCVRAGLGMIEAAHAHPAHFNVRVGIHVGPVVAGILGRRTYQFDIWGDAVNTAARMESHGVPGHITLSSEAWRAIEAYGVAESLGIVDVKGKGKLEVFRFKEWRPQAEPLVVAATA